MIDDILLELGGLLLVGSLCLHGDDLLLLQLHAIVDACLIGTGLNIWSAAQDVALLREMASDHRISAGVLLDWLGIMLQLVIKLLTVIKNLHQFVINLITIELFKDILLVLELVLRLFGLLGSLLLLDHGESVFGLFDF